MNRFLQDTLVQHFVHATRLSSITGEALTRTRARTTTRTTTSLAVRPSSNLCKHALSSSRSIPVAKRLPSSSSSRFFSTSSHFRSGRPNWYAGRPVQTIRSGPIQKLQAAIDRRIPKLYLFYGIIGTNVAVFLAWQYADNAARRFRDFGPIQFMYTNFAAAWVNISRPWTLITSCFSHIDTGHIFVNLFSFWFMAPAALGILSSSQFLGLYLLAGLAGNAVQLLSNLVSSKDLRIPRFSVGASGAINGVLAFFAMAFPYQQLILFLVVPVPAWAAVSGLVCYDMYRALRQPNGTVGAAAHLGGAGAGVLYFLRLRRLRRV